MGRWPSRWLGWRSLPLANLFHLLMDQDQGSLRPADKAVYKTTSSSCCVEYGVLELRMMTGRNPQFLSAV
uniref:DUF3778 domain-containing protein n=1 Tax=Oryza barthii TaxID=65489 RepID=A0A0D3F8P2_9ORYZ